MSFAIGTPFDDENEYVRRALGIIPTAADARRPVPIGETADQPPTAPAAQMSARATRPAPIGESQPESAAPEPATPAVVKQAGPTPIGNPQLVEDQNRLRYLQRAGSGVDQITKPVDDQGNPTGKHVGIGKKIVGGLARVGDIALGAMFPSVAALTPGTTIHHRGLVNQAGQRVANDIGADNEEALANERNAHADSLRAPEDATGTPDQQAFQDYLKKVNPQTQKLYTPQEALQALHQITHENEKPEYLKTDQGYFAVGADGKLAPLTYNGQALNAPEKPPGNPDVKTLYDPATHSFHQFRLGPNGEKLTDLGPAQPTFAETGLYESTMASDGKGNMVPALLNKRTGQITIPKADGPVAVPHAAQGEINKELDTARNADRRLTIMQDNYKRASEGDQQAMVSLVANHIGMTLGAQKGARINQAVWDEAVASRPWMQGAEARFDKRGLLSGVVLSPQQMTQMLSLAKEVRDSQWTQVNQAMGQYGVNAPNTVPTDVRGGAPKVGDTKKFSNGKTGRWDGKGWVAQ